MPAETASLSGWDTVQLARHPDRPRGLYYLSALFPDWIELHGDRVSGEDPALVAGPATLDGHSLMVIAQVRGRTPEEQAFRRKGMTSPAGFRKAVRLAEMAGRLNLPILTLIDTPGAYPGAEAEEQGQAFAISSVIDTFCQLPVPVVACVIGEGGSGGALALSVSDRLLMQEHAIFPVISPEACSSILYRDGTHAASMANALKLTAPDLLRMKLIDAIVPEPVGGGQTDPTRASEMLKRALTDAFSMLRNMTDEARLAARYARLRGYGTL